ncbi:hypothetical protein PN499_27245 [Kamptonema animale CS-326]|uniref:hypothetical protein n=1 Tax=Kamptonema animale TaxID=92934 RepID=UPI00232E8643|nr:hypothetical protein [Kamptonema animale]MDB9514903.1 hypothetical protein [Kamptonema animale CS-326]
MSNLVIFPRITHNQAGVSVAENISTLNCAKHGIFARPTSQTVDLTTANIPC